MLAARTAEKKTNTTESPKKSEAAAVAADATVNIAE